MMNCINKLPLLLSILLEAAAFTQAVSPDPHQRHQEANPVHSLPFHPKDEPSSSRPNGDDFKWSVTSFKNSQYHPNVYNFVREPSERYLQRLESDPQLWFERLHSIRHNFHKGTKAELATQLVQAHQAGRINDVEYQVYSNNLDARIKGRKLVEKGHAIKIQDTVHHPKEMSSEQVAQDFTDQKTARMLMLNVPDVRSGAHAMMLLRPPPLKSSPTEQGHAQIMERPRHLHVEMYNIEGHQAGSSQYHNPDYKGKEHVSTESFLPNSIEAGAGSTQQSHGITPHVPVQYHHKWPMVDHPLPGNIRPGTIHRHDVEPIPPVHITQGHQPFEHNSKSSSSPSPSDYKKQRQF